MYYMMHVCVYIIVYIYIHASYNDVECYDSLLRIYIYIYIVDPTFTVHRATFKEDYTAALESFGWMFSGRSQK